MAIITICFSNTSYPPSKLSKLLAENLSSRLKPGDGLDLSAFQLLHSPRDLSTPGSFCAFVYLLVQTLDKLASQRRPRLRRQPKRVSQEFLSV